ncbi:MAG TPA: hypothetical protein DIU00_14965 [Phycisphaerales bacterium]|nr:hypothetical protein [Phycisphaerales bacterium]
MGKTISGIRGVIKGVRYILGKQGIVNFTFFRKIEHSEFSNKFVANNSVLMIALIRIQVGQAKYIYDFRYPLSRAQVYY